MFTLLAPMLKTWAAYCLIAISDARRVCNDGLALLSFETPVAGPMRCRIELLDRVPDKDAAWELIKSRAAPQ